MRQRIIGLTILNWICNVCHKQSDELINRIAARLNYSIQLADSLTDFVFIFPGTLEKERTKLVRRRKGIFFKCFTCCSPLVSEINVPQGYTDFYFLESIFGKKQLNENNLLRI